jgi:CheY-like chemotaxis protein
LLTAASEPTQVSEGIRAGCFYYLTKPFDRAVLNAVLSSALRDFAYRFNVQTGLQRFKKAIEDERHSTHQATLLAAYHYLNNSLNQFQLVLMELEANGSIDVELLKEIKNSITKTAEDMREFGQLKNPTRENVQQFIKDHL